MFKKITILLSAILFTFSVNAASDGELLLNKALNMQEKAGNLTSILSENLSAYKEVRAFNLESREKERFLNVSENFIDARMKVIKYSHMLTK